MESPEKLESYLSTLYHSLRAARRRYVIQFLKETDDRTFTVRILARKIASVEQDVPERRATGEPYRNAYNALSQTHLPTLSDAKIIIYDSKRQTVARGARFELAALILDTNTPIVQVFSSLSGEADDIRGE